MPDLTPCMRLVVRMPQADQDEVVARVDAYIGNGMPPAQAQRMAVKDLLAELAADEKEIRGLAEAKQPAAAPVEAPPPAAEPQASLAEEPAPEAGPGFYSALRRELANAKTNASPAEYWRNLIKGAVSKGLVKADEVQWSGVNEWLDSQPGKISKTAVLDHLDLNGVRVGETVLGSAIPRHMLPSDWTVERDGDGGFIVVDEDGEMRGEGATEQEAMRDAADPDVVADIGSVNGMAKYGQYTLPGGTNYREVLLTLPPGKELSGLTVTGSGNIRIIRAGGENIGSIAQDTSGAWRVTALADAVVPFERKRYPSVNDAVADIEHKDKQTYRSNHWDQPNVLAHIRVNDRVDSDGKRVLLVEEIQSDFGQDFKKQRAAIAKAVDSDFNGIVERMKMAGVLEVVCD